MIRRLILTLFIATTSLIAFSQTWGDKAAADGKLFVSVETPPKYPGGMAAFYRLLADSLQAPDKKFSEFSNKTVMLEIILDTTGKPVYAKVDKGINEMYNQAALAIVARMPRWTPALQNGRAVKYVIYIPVIFID